MLVSGSFSITNVRPSNPLMFDNSSALWSMSREFLLSVANGDEDKLKISVGFNCCKSVILSSCSILDCHAKRSKSMKSTESIEHLQSRSSHIMVD